MEFKLKGHYAGFVSRLVAYGIDLAIVVLLLIAIGWLISATQQIFRIEQVIGTQIIQVALAGSFALLFTASYYVLFWVLAGQTPGKMIMGVRIVTGAGEPPSFWQSVRRFVGYLISYMTLFAGFLWILVDNRRQGWHDKLAGTYVIYIWDAEPGKYYVAEARRRQEMQQDE